MLRAICCRLENGINSWSSQNKKMNSSEKEYTASSA
jgi:hypothetical protein